MNSWHAVGSIFELGHRRCFPLKRRISSPRFFHHVIKSLLLPTWRPTPVAVVVKMGCSGYFSRPDEKLKKVRRDLGFPRGSRGGVKGPAPTLSSFDWSTGGERGRERERIRERRRNYPRTCNPAAPMDRGVPKVKASQRKRCHQSIHQPCDCGDKLLQRETTHVLVHSTDIGRPLSYCTCMFDGNRRKTRRPPANQQKTYAAAGANFGYFDTSEDAESRFQP